MIERLPAPGSRRDHYRPRDEAWPTLFSTQNTVVHVMLQAAETGIAATASGDPAHARLTRMRDFYQFLLGELPGLLRRWEHSQVPAEHAAHRTTASGIDHSSLGQRSQP